MRFIDDYSFFFPGTAVIFLSRSVTFRPQPTALKLQVERDMFGWRLQKAA
jgi:hypothetical protein